MKYNHFIPIPESVETVKGFDDEEWRNYNLTCDDVDKWIVDADLFSPELDFDVKQKVIANYEWTKKVIRHRWDRFQEQHRN